VNTRARRKPAEPRPDPGFASEVGRLGDGDSLVLNPHDVEEVLLLAARQGLQPKVTMLDPWYNKGVGGQRADYVDYIVNLLKLSSALSPHVFLWGFPEIIARFIERLPAPLTLNCWLTWYYKNNPSVIRGWRSSQMACLHLTRPDAVLYPEHFLNEAQLEKKAAGKLRYMPGPPSVIESALIIGFVGRSEQTGHPSQKPCSVYEPLYRMTTRPGDLVLDPMAGSGTTGAAARKLGFRAVLNDVEPKYVATIERRLGIRRVSVPRSAGRSRSAPNHRAASPS
jgi:site-specific DNA-methyltransferase (adenine-specific)